MGNLVIELDLIENQPLQTGFNGYVYDFSVDYDATDFDDILDIHKYLMKKKLTYCK